MKHLVAHAGFEGVHGGSVELLLHRMRREGAEQHGEAAEGCAERYGGAGTGWRMGLHSGEATRRVGLATDANRCLVAEAAAAAPVEVARGQGDADDGEDYESEHAA